MIKINLEIINSEITETDFPDLRSTLIGTIVEFCARDNNLDVNLVIEEIQIATSNPDDPPCEQRGFRIFGG